MAMVGFEASNHLDVRARWHRGPGAHETPLGACEYGASGETWGRKRGEGNKERIDVDKEIR